MTGGSRNTVLCSECPLFQGRDVCNGHVPEEWHDPATRLLGGCYLTFGGRTLKYRSWPRAGRKRIRSFFGNGHEAADSLFVEVRRARDSNGYCFGCLRRTPGGRDGWRIGAETPT